MGKYDYELNMGHFSGMKHVEEGLVVMPISGIRIIRFLDDAGDECISYTCEGDASLPRTLGMLEWTKIELANSAFNPDEDD